ncbi:MAG TPA: hypothetical protein VKK31_32100 [Thermoanaerobaculia bacterium]|nr:hypothetical protein [Thermoanaerobaculia bacterium]
MATPGRPREDAFRRLTFFSVIGGLCPLIPVPFMDDWALEQVQRRMIGEIGRDEGLGWSPQEVKVLAGGEEDVRMGCLGRTVWAVREVAGAILGKLFRTVFYFLTIRRSARRSAETLQLGYLVLHAARLPQTDRPADWASTVRGAVAAALAEVDAGPVYRTLARDFRRSLSLLVQAASLFRRFLPRRRQKKSGGLPEGEVFREEEKLLGGFVDRLAADLWGNRAYFAELETALERNLTNVSS